MLEMIFVILVGLVTVSALFPRYLPRVDTIRVRAQQMFFSSLSAVRYPDAPIRDALVQESVFAHLATHMQVGDILFSHRA